MIICDWRSSGNGKREQIAEKDNIVSLLSELGIDEIAREVDEVLHADDEDNDFFVSTLLENLDDLADESSSSEEIEVMTDVPEPRFLGARGLLKRLRFGL